jgi:hypothetical protein
MIIGMVTGVGTAIAMSIGMTVFFIRSRESKNGSDGRSSLADRDRANILIGPFPWFRAFLAETVTIHLPQYNNEI